MRPVRAPGRGRARGAAVLAQGRREQLRTSRGRRRRGNVLLRRQPSRRPSRARRARAPSTRRHGARVARRVRHHEDRPGGRGGGYEGRRERGRVRRAPAPGLVRLLRRGVREQRGRDEPHLLPRQAARGRQGVPGGPGGRRLPGPEAAAEDEAEQASDGDEQGTCARDGRVVPGGRGDGRRHRARAAVVGRAGEYGGVQRRGDQPRHAHARHPAQSF